MDLFLFARLTKRKVGTIFRTMWLDLLTRRIEFVVAGNTSKLGCKDAILISGWDAIEGGSRKEKEEKDLDKRNRGDWKCNSRSASSLTLVNRYWNEQQDEEDYSLFGLKRNWKFPPPLFLCFFSFFLVLFAVGRPVGWTTGMDWTFHASLLGLTPSPLWLDVTLFIYLLM